MFRSVARCVPCWLIHLGGDWFVSPLAVRFTLLWSSQGRCLVFCCVSWISVLDILIPNVLRKASKLFRFFFLPSVVSLCVFSMWEDRESFGNQSFIVRFPLKQKLEQSSFQPYNQKYSEMCIACVRCVAVTDMNVPTITVGHLCYLQLHILLP